MFGLFERIGEGLEMVALPISGAMSSARCAVSNFATDVRTEAKCRAIDREAKYSSSKESDEKKSNIGNISKIFENAAAGNIEDLKNLSEESIKSLKEELAKATPEELVELSKSVESLDLIGRLIFSARAEIDKATNQKTPILQPQMGSIPLHEQAAQKGGVTGKDIVENLRNQQDIQHANPQGINNPNPVQA